MDAAGSMPLTSMCGENLCVDLANPQAAGLSTVNGALTVVAPTDRIILVRTTATEIVALSDVCTHEGCAMSYSASLMQLTCPCHGSQFALTGAVTRGPAQTAVRVYETMISADGETLTIVLG